MLAVGIFLMMRAAYTHRQDYGSSFLMLPINIVLLVALHLKDTLHSLVSVIHCFLASQKYIQTRNWSPVCCTFKLTQMLWAYKFNLGSDIILFTYWPRQKREGRK